MKLQDRQQDTEFRQLSSSAPLNIFWLFEKFRLERFYFIASGIVNDTVENTSLLLYTIFN